MIPAILLAAGASTRMGRPKALLLCPERVEGSAAGRTFVRTILDSLRDGGVTDAAVVIRPGDGAIVDEIASAGFGRAVVNARPEDGQLTSLIAGLDALEEDAPEISGVLVTLVDVPLVRLSLIHI